MAKSKQHTPTDENLLAFGLQPTLRWLIAAALDGSVMTYGDVKRKLEGEIGFSTVFPPRIGFVAGSLMEKIQHRLPDGPLINVLIVNQNDQQPSEGAGPFMAARFEEPRLGEKKAKKKYPKLWEQTFRSAADEVYGYGQEKWAKLYKKVFGAELSLDQISHEREERKRGKEKDGIQTGRNYGPGGEGKFHRDLRLWTMKNPGAVDASFLGAEAETESDLDSGDRIDVVYRCPDRIVLLEVKSRVSNEIDLKRGVYQCIKYRAVRAAMDVAGNPLIESYLVTEKALPRGVAALLRLHKIKHFLAPLVRK